MNNPFKVTAAASDLSRAQNFRKSSDAQEAALNESLSSLQLEIDDGIIPDEDSQKSNAMYIPQKSVIGGFERIKVRMSVGSETKTRQETAKFPFSRIRKSTLTNTHV